jgi:hypothetical protein
MTRVRFVARFACTASLSLFPVAISPTFAVTRPVQASAEADADLLEIRNHRLTLDGLRQLGEIYKRLAKEAGQHPKTKQLADVEAKLAALGEKEELTEVEEERMHILTEQIARIRVERDAAVSLGDPKTLSEMERKIESTPALSRAVREGGMTARQFATAQMALAQSLMAYGFQKSGAMKELPKEVSKENVEFLRAHEEEVRALTAEWKTLSDDRLR